MSKGGGKSGGGGRFAGGGINKDLTDLNLDKKKGPASFIKNAFRIMIGIGILLAILQVARIGGPRDAWEWGVEQSDRFRECWDSGECNLQSPFPGTDFQLNLNPESGEGSGILNIPDDGSRPSDNWPGSENWPTNQGENQQTQRPGPGFYYNEETGEWIHYETNEVYTPVHNVIITTFTGERYLDEGTIGYRGPEYNEPYIPASARITQEYALYLLYEHIMISYRQDINYNRRDWRHWIPYELDHPCWTVRSQILYNQARPGTIVMLDRNRNETEARNQACAILSGEWICPYSSTVITDPSEITISHVFSLPIANASGGSVLGITIKEQFANNTNNLLAVSTHEHERRNEGSPGDWMPSNRDYHCSYAKIYITTAHQWNLSITQEDKDILSYTIRNACHF